MEFAKGVIVPFKADGVDSPDLFYIGGSITKSKMNCLLFSIADESDYVGRVTFEGFDSIRCSRGEYMPYKYERDSQFPWVFEIENSSWLLQRHEYETRNYKTPLLDEYVHYLFRFHDEFVELIAKGIWFERLEREDAHTEPGPDHPLRSLSESLESENFVVKGIPCSVRHNPLPPNELFDRSKLCSQTQFQYFLTLDGETKPSYAAQMRTVRGTTKTRLRGGLFYKDLWTVAGTDITTAQHTGQESDFRKPFEKWVAEVAERRRQMGKTN